MPILGAIRKLIHGEEVMKFRVGRVPVSVRRHPLSSDTIHVGDSLIKADILKQKGKLHVSIEKHRKTKYVHEHLEKLPRAIEEIARRHKSNEVLVSVPKSLVHLFEGKGWREVERSEFSRNPFMSIPISDFVVLSKRLKGR